MNRGPRFNGDFGYDRWWQSLNPLVERYAIDAIIKATTVGPLNPNPMRMPLRWDEVRNLCRTYARATYAYKQRFRQQIEDSSEVGGAFHHDARGFQRARNEAIAELRVMEHIVFFWQQCYRDRRSLQSFLEYLRNMRAPFSISRWMFPHWFRR